MKIWIPWKDAYGKIDWWLLVGCWFGFVCTPVGMVIGFKVGLTFGPRAGWIVFFTPYIILGSYCLVVACIRGMLLLKKRIGRAKGI